MSVSGVRKGLLTGVALLGVAMSGCGGEDDNDPGDKNAEGSATSGVESDPNSPFDRAAEVAAYKNVEAAFDTVEYVEPKDGSAIPRLLVEVKLTNRSSEISVPHPDVTLTCGDSPTYGAPTYDDGLPTDNTLAPEETDVINVELLWPVGEDFDTPLDCSEGAVIRLVHPSGSGDRTSEISRHVVGDSILQKYERAVADKLES